MYALVGIMVLLLGGAIYSALVLAKKTDETILKFGSEDAAERPLVVRFPDEVFQRKTVDSKR